ncbi:hypothetical protein Daus18300_002310 [Diaporthe australafricana]|uniref:SnoaL-like polyketide cyclase n=1 Tax=Diaporthe australafricana TaxID=127596 RepID=A0ABR3XPM9_9PEZI
MTSATDANTVLLELLEQHIKNKPHEHTEITINEAKHTIVSFAVDLLVKDTASSLLAARVILTVRDVPNPDAPRDQPTIDLAAHITTNPDLSASTVILEAPQAGTPAPAPRRTSTIPTHPATHPAGTKALAETYRDYISTFMADPATAAAGLPRFLHQPVTHNTRSLTIPAYHNLLQDVRAAVPDIACEIVELVAAEDRQIVAARLEFVGTPVREFAGAQPDGWAVRIGEIVFYWFDEGRIREVVSLLDFKGPVGQP